MDQQTQIFLALVSDELTQAVFAQLEPKSLTTTELAKATGTDPRDLAKHLDALKLSALLSSRKGPPKGPGRRPVYWERINSDVLEELNTFVGKSRHRLIDRGDG